MTIIFPGKRPTEVLWRISYNKNGSRAGHPLPSPVSIIEEQGFQIYRPDRPPSVPRCRCGSTTILMKLTIIVPTRIPQSVNLSPRNLREKIPATTVHGQKCGCCRAPINRIDFNDCPVKHLSTENCNYRITSSAVDMLLPVLRL